MQQDKNDIEEKLRQLDNQQLPDLSRMDEHWESMKLALQPALTVNQRKKKWLWFVGLLLIAGTTTLFIARKYVSAEKEILPKVITQQHEPLVETPLADSFVSKQPVMPVTPVVNNAGKTRPVSAAILKPVAENKEVDLVLQFDEKNSTLKAVNPDAQKILNELLGSLAKMAEEFVVDNSRDTTLFGAEGSSLYIPANSLGGGGEIKIRLKEFYKTSDIVMNKLSTTSDGEQLITGGMVHISASSDDSMINILPGKSIKLFVADTSKQMEEMELFTGEILNNNVVNWKNNKQKFNSPIVETITQLWVLDIINQPAKVFNRRKGPVGVFVIDKNRSLSRRKLRDMLKQKYGYHKVKFRNKPTWHLEAGFYTSGITDGLSNNPVGDSVWIEKSEAERFKLEGTISRTIRVLRINVDAPKNIIYPATGNKDTISKAIQNGIVEIQRKYSVDISSLGWINCDRFYKDRREKIDYIVDLQDSAANYFTIMVFSKMRSVMTGHVVGNRVQFGNVPAGELVKIISIGVDKKGETVMAMQETKINNKGLSGLPFESAAAPEIKSSLKKIDN